MNLQGFYTTKGLTLAAKLAAGAKLSVTKVTAGSGTTAVAAAGLAETKQTLTVGTTQTEGQSAVLPVTLAEVSAAASYLLTELGVYAKDPDAGEILYQVFRLDESRSVTAGGENVYRFYLKQTVGAAGVTVTCSSAGLLTEADFEPTRSKVLSTAAGTVNAGMAAAELQAYLNALPRLLTADYTITVSGTHAGMITLNGFYGSGSITIRAAEVGDCALSNMVQVLNCAVPISIQKIKWQEAVGGLGTGQSYLRISNAPVILENCVLLGRKDDGTQRPGGVSLQEFGVLYAKDCIFKTLTFCAQTYYGGYAELLTVQDGTLFEDNYAGVATFYGGIILLTGKTPDLLGSTWNHRNGGLLVGADGKVL